MDDCLDLESDPELVVAARAFVRSRLESWEAADLIWDAEMVASELVTNAVLHARTQIRLRVALDSTTVRIEVFDANPRLPTVMPCSAEATSGRGLAMVTTLASSWGIEQQPDGKVIWAQLGPPPTDQPEDCLDLKAAGTVEEAVQQVTLRMPGEV